MTGKNRGLGGLEALGIENAKPMHHELLFGGVYILENMDLGALARDNVYEFLYLTLSERIKGATGSPVRPIAIR